MCVFARMDVKYVTNLQEGQHLCSKDRTQTEQRDLCMLLVYGCTVTSVRVKPGDVKVWIGERPFKRIQLKEGSAGWEGRKEGFGRGEKERKRSR